jgi:NTE family protein
MGYAAARRVALVIGSGSVKCAAVLGLQKVLQREGIEIDLVVGCSAGSMYAALIAAGHDPEVSAEMTKRLWTRELTSEKDRMSLLRAVFPRLFGFDSSFGLRKDTKAMRVLRNAYGDMQFSDAKIPLFITATDFANGDQVVLSSGSVVDAIRASIGIPYIFKPWTIDGRQLIDGFMSDPLPINVAIREGASVIIAMGFESPMQTKINSVGRFSFQLSSIMTNNLLKSRYAFHNLTHHSEVILIVPEFEQRVRLFDTEKVPYIIEVGERAAEQQLPYLRRLLAEFPAEGQAV